MRTVCTYGGLNLNDGVTWFLRPGFSPGERLKTWAEYRSYTGAPRQYNVSEASLIEMRVPLRVQAASLAGLRTAVAALNTLVDGGERTLVYDGVSYSCAHSRRVELVIDDVAATCFSAAIEFTPMRYP